MSLTTKIPPSLYPFLLTIFLSIPGCGRHVETEGRDIPLFRAASDGDEKKVELLLSAGANVDAREEEGETPLMYAAANGRRQMVLFLLQRGADINAVSKNGETALVRAAQVGQTETVKSLLERGANVELGLPLIRASYAGHADTVLVLLRKGADPNAELLGGDTALAATAVQGSPGAKDVLQELVTAGANIQHKNKKGKTAEMLAVENGHPELADFLNKAGRASRHP